MEAASNSAEVEAEVDREVEAEVDREVEAEVDREVEAEVDREVEAEVDREVEAVPRSAEEEAEVEAIPRSAVVEAEVEGALSRMLILVGSSAFILGSPPEELMPLKRLHPESMEHVLSCGTHLPIVATIMKVCCH